MQKTKSGFKCSDSDKRNRRQPGAPICPARSEIANQKKGQRVANDPKQVRECR
jgi:hypothetical protein